MALIAYGAQGDTAAVAANSQGGLFHLTDERVEGGYRAFVINVRNMKILEGVWTWDSANVNVEWSTGDKKQYPFEVWKANAVVLNKIRQQQEGN